MASGEETSQVREAVGVFDTADALQAAIDELQTSGFDLADISLMTSEHVVEEKLGHRYKKVAEMEDDANVPRDFLCLARIDRRGARRAGRGTRSMSARSARRG